MQKDNKNQKWAFGPFSLSLEEIIPHLLISKMTETQIVKAIKEMSIKFTKKRDQIGDYVLDHQQVSAYASFYLPTNIPKLHFLLDKLSTEILEDLKNRPFIDMGAGPGTYSLGYKILMNTGAHVEIIAVDSAQIMLDQATKLMNGFFPGDKFQAIRKFSEKKSNSILFFGHSINEMGINKVQDLIMTIDPEYVMWIEPGTSQLFLELKKLRSAMVESYDQLYPCPSNEACPNEWCHQVLRISHDPSVERLSQLVSLDRKTMPMIAHAYRRKSSKHVSLKEATVVRFINETKFSFEYEVCFFKDHQNQNRVIEIQKKHLDKNTEKHFKNLNVGEKISFDIEKEVGEKLRVLLKSE